MRGIDGGIKSYILPQHVLLVFRGDRYHAPSAIFRRTTGSSQQPPSRARKRPGSGSFAANRSAAMGPSWIPSSTPRAGPAIPTMSIVPPTGSFARASSARRTPRCSATSGCCSRRRIRAARNKPRRPGSGPRLWTGFPARCGRKASSSDSRGEDQHGQGKGGLARRACAGHRAVRRQYAAQVAALSPAGVPPLPHRGAARDHVGHHRPTVAQNCPQRGRGGSPARS